MDDNALQERVIDLIKPLIPHDAEERVTRAFRQWNQIIRDHIRSETALRLADGDGRNSVNVRIVEGFPVGFAKLIDNYRDPMLWRLIVGQPKLGGIIEGLTFLLEDWNQFEDWPRLPQIARNGEPALRRTLEISASLQQATLTQQVRDEIKAIREDILGAYHFSLGRNSWVEIYWMPIAMVAAMLDVRIEDLTVVVLAHELTHGYTHIGRDIDGLQWSDAAFRECELDIVEGLAQFYTEIITEKVATRSPGPKLAFERLLELQSDPYHAHQQWGNSGDRQRGESVRFTMVVARSQEPMTHDDWLALLHETRQSLKKRTTQQY